MQVYQSILNVIRDMGANPIKKERVNSFQRYNFRGIEDVLAALNPLLVKHNLVILPRVMEHRSIQGKTKNGDPQQSAYLLVEYDIVNTEDFSKHTVSAVGEANDTSDKSYNKAMSTAYKYMAFTTFCIPTEGVHTDTEEESPSPTIAPPSKGPEDALRAACNEWLETIKSNHNIVITPPMTVELVKAQGKEATLQNMLLYLTDLSTRLYNSGEFTDKEKLLLKLK